MFPSSSVSSYLAISKFSTTQLLDIHVVITSCSFCMLPNLIGVFMNRLDGEFISIGDSVFDIINGSGTVIDSTNTALTVRFTNNRKMNFTTDGKYNGTRRIFWHNPIIVAPDKDGAVWSATTTAVVGLVQFLNATK